MTRVFDCFPFFNEADLLRTRLRELRDVVDHFILVEGDRTHTGAPKPFFTHGEEYGDIYREHAGQLVSVRVGLPGGPSPTEPWLNWGREIFQRSAINGALSRMGAADDDIVISSDVDEVPKTQVVEAYRDRADICSIEMATYHYNLNCRLDTPTVDPKICRYRDVKAVGVADLRYYHQAHPVHVIKDGGWHLSFMGGTDRIIEKLGAYAHYDARDPRMAVYMSRENVEASVNLGKSLFLRDDITYSRVDRPDLPKHISGNLRYFIDRKWLAGP